MGLGGEPKNTVTSLPSLILETLAASFRSLRSVGCLSQVLAFHAFSRALEDRAYRTAVTLFLAIQHGNLPTCAHLKERHCI